MRNLALLVLLAVFIGCGQDSDKKEVALSIPYGERNITEPLYYQQWYLDYNQTLYETYGIDEKAHIDFADVSTLYSGKGVKIAVIDDGLDVWHEDLAGAVGKAFNIETNSSDVSNDYGWDNHGTAVTGIIGARRNEKGILGVAPQSEIIFLKMPLLATDAQTVELFEEANRSGADIINCSWGTYSVSDTVKEVIDTLATKGREGRGIVIVFASGNDNSTFHDDESAIPSVISVGATGGTNLRSDYSNYGEELDIMAPGGGFIEPGGLFVGITTLDVTGFEGQSSSEEPDYLLLDDAYSFGGTSASAPIVSGAVALLLEADPSLTRREIQDILKKSSDKIGPVEYSDGRNDFYGYGKLNLKKALEAVLLRK